MATDDFSHLALKARQRDIRDDFPEAMSLRVHRALSWLDRAEQASDDDGRFIFLWIAFNAAYAQEFEDRKDATEREVLVAFLDQLIEIDADNLLYEIVWSRYQGPIRLLIDNKFVFQPFWDWANMRIPEQAWIEQFERSKQNAHRALGRMETGKVLAVMFDRLYTLRNQLIHGGATWNSSVNRHQVCQAAEILGDLVPVIISLMMDCPECFLSDPCYPVMD